MNIESVQPDPARTDAAQPDLARPDLARPDLAKPTLEGLEVKWDAVWEQEGTYRFDRTKDRSQVFSIDTPPPTVSGELHLGSVFGYVQVDAMARYMRMSGREVFYPMGWDDNGLPTERRVQNVYGVRCDPSLPYEQGLVVQPLTDSKDDKNKPVQMLSRANFLELCHELTAIDEVTFENVWRTVGLSVDWALTYATIDDHCRRVAQRAFLRNLQRGEAYASEAPTLWDVDFQTAVAQAELEDRDTASAYHKLAFALADGSGVIEIDTTRPELLPACVALVAHPEDSRFKDIAGTEVFTPVFGVRVPIVLHPLADPEKGTGIAMVCTFGDTTDIIWWRELNLPTRSILRRDGRLLEDTPEWLPEAGAALWPDLAGSNTKQARRKIVDLLTEAGALIGEIRPIQHPVKYYEKGDRPLEIVTSRQWYIRNGAKDSARSEALVAAGRRLDWHPDFMRIRYEHWVGGLNSDWLISRQRHFGVPFPVWYRIDASGEPLLDDPILADESSLPIDPQGQTPAGFSEDQRGQPGGFIGDSDVMDTWATSSLTPQIVCGWEEDDDLFARTFPMDLRPQGPEIIRTWLFSTMLRSQLEHGTEPWTNTSINGWILDPDRKKMAKSKGNVVTPAPLLEKHGSDGVRYWALNAAPGIDTAIDDAQMKVGRRLALKLLNASRFVLGQGDDIAAAVDGQVTEAVDRAMLAKLAGVVAEATTAFEGYQYQRALERTETFFWNFCDDYLELVKLRAYGTDQASASAKAGLAIALSSLQRMLAPFLPFAAEEAWSWWQAGSIHRSPWPSADELLAKANGATADVLDVAASVLTEIRKAKSAAKRGMVTPVDRLVVTDTAERIAAFRLAEGDVCRAGVVGLVEVIEVIQEIEVTVGGVDFAVTVELQPPAESVATTEPQPLAPTES